MRYWGLVMSKLEKYPKYKDSGVEWIGEIPEEWEVKKLKFLVKEHSGNGFPITEQNNKQGTIPFYKVSDINSNADYLYNANNYVTFDLIKNMKWNLVPINSIVAAKIGEALRKNHRKITTEKSIIDNNCIAIEPLSIDVKYNFYLHKIIDFDWFSNPGAVPSISVFKYKNFHVMLPPKQEQIKIANYLDKKTAQIDKAITLKEQLIEKLKERRQVLINDAITKGLDKNAKMKDSGVEWIGEIPEGWEVKKLKYSLKLQNKKIRIEEQQVVALENIESFTGKYIETTSKYDGEDNFFQKNDILFGKLRPYLAKVFLCKTEGVAFGDLLVFRPKNNFNSKFAFYLLISAQFIKTVDSSTYGSKMPRASSSFINEMLIGVPPKEEQIQIAEYIEANTQKIDKAIDLQQKQIEKLKEYKATLIDSVVTGKVRICGQLPHS